MHGNRPCRVVMVHGAGGGAWEWNVWRRLFALDGHAVHASDLEPGARGLAATTLDDYAVQLLAAIARARSAPVGAHPVRDPARTSRDDVAPPSFRRKPEPGDFEGDGKALDPGLRRDDEVGGDDALPADARQMLATDASEALPADAPLVLVGASLGGLLAAMVAQRAGAQALVLVNALPPAPWHARLPAGEAYPAVVPWGSERDLFATRRSLFDADDATCLYAHERWRDESGAVLNAARGGVEVARPPCTVLMLASTRDDDVPPDVTAAWAQAWDADLLRIPEASHVGPLLGRGAAACAELALRWLATRV